MLPLPKKSKIQSRKLAIEKSGLDRYYYNLSRMIDKNKTESQTLSNSTKSSVDKTIEISGSNKEILGRSLTQQNTNNKILQEIILALKEKDTDNDDLPDINRRNRTSKGRPVPNRRATPSRTKPRVEPTLRRPPISEHATRTQAPKPTATQQPRPRPGRIAVGGGLEYDVGTRRYHDPNLPGNRNMISKVEATRRGAAAPSTEQIEEARKTRATARVTPPPAPVPPAPELRANPTERLVPPAPSAGPNRVQRIDEAAGRALSSTGGRAAIGGLSALAALPLVIEAYNAIRSLPTSMPRNEYEQQVTTIILQLVAAGIALPYIGAIIGGFLGSAAFPGMGTIAGLGAGLAGGWLASRELDSVVKELVSKIVEHFYDRARRQSADDEHIRYYRAYRSSQNRLPQSQRGLPDNIEELQRLLIAASVTARSGGTQLRPEAGALVGQIYQRIQALRELEQQREAEEQHRVQPTPDQTSSIGQDISLTMMARDIDVLSSNHAELYKSNISEAFRAMDRSEYRNLTFEASTIVFEGDIGQNQQEVTRLPSTPGIIGAAASAETPASMPAVRMAAPAITGEGGSGVASIPTISGGGAPGPLASSGAPTAPNRFEPRSGEQTSADFTTELNAVATRLGVQPNDLLAVMRSETGGTLNPSIPNAAGSGAVGLIQFMPSTARGLGTSTEELGRMSQTEQLRYVEAYFRQNRLPRGASAAMIYAYTFMPAAARNNPNQLAVRGTNYYAANQGLDVNDDGVITIDDLDRFLRGERRGRAGQRVSSTPQTGAEMAGTSASIEAERIRRQSRPNPTVVQQPASNQLPRASVATGSDSLASGDVALKYRLRQAVA